MRNAEHRALDWAERLVDINGKNCTANSIKLFLFEQFVGSCLGLQRLMEIASEMDEMKYESAMETTENTRTSVAVLLGKVFDNMYYDLARERFSAKIEEFIQYADRLKDPLRNQQT